MVHPKENKISLVVPMRNEEASICELISCIKSQTYQPAEIILVDGGSNDRTVSVAGKCVGDDERFRILELDQATPGKGRNVGIAESSNEWIALTDAGIILEKDWLERLVEKTSSKDPYSATVSKADIVYGCYDPVVTTFFEKIAMFSYVSARVKGTVRGKFIAGTLLRKAVWEGVGGFPDLRAAEDLAFMEEAERLGFKHVFAPDAKVSWQLRPDLASTYRKFVLYSEHNVYAGKQWDWHYGILRQYAMLIPVILLAMFHSWWWALLVPVWLLARAAKRILSHRYEFGLGPLFNPLIVGGVAGLILVIDFATFAGWIKAKTSGRE